MELLKKEPRMGMWFAFNTGYANGALWESHISTLRFGGTFSLPLGMHHSLTLFSFTTIRMDQGSDYALYPLAYQYRWGDK